MMPGSRLYLCPLEREHVTLGGHAPAPKLLTDFRDAGSQ
jgi:hypothetical protein